MEEKEAIAAKNAANERVKSLEAELGKVDESVANAAKELEKMQERCKVSGDMNSNY